MAFFGLIGGRNKTKTKAQTNSEIDSIIERGNEPAPKLNPEFNTFRAITRRIEDIITNNSEISRGLEKTAGMNPGDFFTSLNGIDIMPVVTSKISRIQQWRMSSAYPEVNFCLEQIADDFLHFNENDDFVQLTINDRRGNLNVDRQEILQNEFYKFISLFNFRKNYFNLVKRFLIEGELAWENVIDPERPSLGIRAVKFIPAEYYEALVDKVTGERVGIFIDMRKLKMDINSIVSSSYFNSYKAFNALYGTTINSYSNDSCLPFLWPQVTYICSAETTPDGLIPLSLMEKCRQSYIQLALMQDAAVVMRVTRAPEKLLFNLDISNMSPKLAKDYVRRFGRDLETKKIIGNPNENSRDRPDGTPNVFSVYHPSVMNTKWVFSKGRDSEGTTVETVGSTANFEQIEDIDFFMRRLLKQMNVPYSRWKTPENVMERDETISYEEYSFSRQEIRFQNLFSEGFEKSFITHLKLRDLWSKYDMREDDIQIKFVPPVLYDLYQNQKLLEAKMAAYSTIADREEFSKIYAMKRVLKMTDDEIKENYDNLLYEGLLMKKVEWAQDQLGEKGPKDQSLPVPLAGEDAEDAEDEETSEEGEGGEGDLSEEPGEGETEEEPPEGGESEETPEEEPEEGGENEIATLG